jgi:hypothetical protein
MTLGHDYTPRQRELLQIIDFSMTRAAEKKLEREIVQEQWNSTLSDLKAELVRLKTGVNIGALFD